MDPEALRRKVCEFVKVSDNSQVQMFREKFEKEGPKKTTWEKFWKGQEKRECLPSFWFIKATALLLNIDVMLVRIADDKKVLHYIEDHSGNMEHPEEALSIGPLVLGIKCNMYYVSLLMKEDGEKLKREDIHREV